MEDTLNYLLNGDGNDTTPITEATADNGAASAQGQAKIAGHEMDGGSYSHYSFAEACYTAKPSSYLIYNEVKSQGLHMTYGEPASGKTFYVIDKAATIACDNITSWHGKHIRHGQVAYFAGEASEGVKLRCKGWAAARNINPENVHMTIFDEVFTLDNEKDNAHTIERTIQQVRTFAPHAVYIIFDTLHAFMHGDENQAVDASRFISMCRKLIREFDCAIELLHHVGVSLEAKSRVRGSSSWRGAMDIMHLVRNTAEGNSGITCVISQEKHKDGKKRKPIVFNMNEVTLPGLFDDDGYPVTTLVPEINKEETAKEKENAQTKHDAPKKDFTRGIKTFKEAAIRYGRLSVDMNASESFVDISLEEWREVAYEILDGDSQSAKRSKFNRARATLVEEIEPPIITHYELENTTYYRLSRNGENEAAFRLEVFTAVMKRDNEKQAAAQ